MTEAQVTNPIYTSVKDTCAILSLGKTSVYALLKEGKLERVKFGRRTLVKTSSIYQFVEDLENPE